MRRSDLYSLGRRAVRDAERRRSPTAPTIRWPSSTCTAIRRCRVCRSGTGGAAAAARSAARQAPGGSFAELRDAESGSRRSMRRAAAWLRNAAAASSAEARSPSPGSCRASCQSPSTMRRAGAPSSLSACTAGRCVWPCTRRDAAGAHRGQHRLRIDVHDALGCLRPICRRLPGVPVRRERGARQRQQQKRAARRGSRTSAAQTLIGVIGGAERIAMREQHRLAVELERAADQRSAGAARASKPLPSRKSRLPCMT